MKLQTILIMAFLLFLSPLTAQDGEVWESLYKGIAGYDIIHYELEKTLTASDPASQLDHFSRQNFDSLKFSIETLDTLKSFHLVCIADSMHMIPEGIRKSTWIVGYELNEDKSISPVFFKVDSRDDLINFINQVIYPQISLYNPDEIIHFIITYLYRKENIVFYSPETRMEFSYIEKFINPQSLCGDAEAPGIFPSTYGRFIKLKKSNYAEYVQLIFDFQWDHLSFQKKIITHQFAE